MLIGKLATANDAKVSDVEVKLKTFSISRKPSMLPLFWSKNVVLYFFKVKQSENSTQI